MKLILDIKKEKLDFILELLHSFKFVNKIETLEEESSTKQEILDGIKEAVQEVKLHKQGKIKLKTAQELLNEL